jgi:hypothetical protein
LGVTETCELHIASAPKEQTLDLNKIVADLKKERDRLGRAITALVDSAMSRGGMKTGATRKPKRATGKKRGGLTPAGRKRLSLAMKKRWAERRKKGS